MDDIVERLRLFVPHCEDPNDYLEDELLFLKAADEIERLREALRLYQCQCEDGQCAAAFDDDERGELCGMPAIAALGEGKE